MISFQVESSVLRGADDTADAVGRFALVVFAAIEGRPWPPFDAPGRRRTSGAAAGKAGAAKGAKGSVGAKSASSARGTTATTRGTSKATPKLPALTAGSGSGASGAARATADRHRSQA